MPRKLIDFELDFMIKDIFPRFTVKQFDDVSFNIKPKKQGLDYDTTGMTGKIFIGVNNDMFMQTKNITVSNNNVNILLDRNMLQKNGRAYAEVELTDSNGTITSSSFIFNIDAKIGEGAKIPGEYEGFVAKYERLISEFKTQVNSTIDNCNTNINSTINNCNKAVDNKLNDVDNFVDNKILDIEKRFNTLTSSQQQDAEVVDARDGETSLKARLDRDIEKAKQVYVNVEGSHISTDSSSGYLKDVEIFGNTIQDEENLADIKSVGDTVEGQELYEIPVVSCGENLFNPKIATLGKALNNTNGKLIDNSSVYTSDYIKCFNGKSYICNRGKITYICIYDNNKTYIKTVNDYKFTSSIDGYFRIHCTYADKDVEEFCVVEGDVIKNISYQEDKLTILSPVQLEKVGDVADRIICKDGVWGVEKNIGTSIIDENRNWVASALEEGVNTKAFQFTFTESAYGVVNTKNKISDKFPSVLHDSSILNSDIEYISGVSNTSSNTAIRINKSRLETVDTAGFKKWISKNPTLVKYQLAQPTFIPLPHDQQIKLRTFANKTNISFLTEIEGTIKAQVPKSLGATVNTHTTQISNLNKELDRVKKLEESTVSTVTTESDFATVEATSNGYFEDVKLEGKTLVNLCPEIKSRYNNCNLETSKGFTVVSKCLLSDWSDRLLVKAIKNDDSVVYLKMLSDGTNDTVYYLKDIKRIEQVYFDPIAPSDFSKFKVIILEGDHTQNPPSYFEGLKSVGQSTSEDGVDEIVVSSVKGDGNLFDVMKIINPEEGGVDYTYDNNNVVTVKNNTALGFGNYMKFKAGKTYYFSGETSNIVNVRIYPVGRYGGNDIIAHIANGQDSFLGSYKCTQDMDVIFRFWKNTGLATVSDVIVSTNPIIEYTPHQSDKKRLLFYNNETQTWEKPILREWDSIEKHSNGKYYYHQRSGEVVLNGGESWTHATEQIGENTLLFYAKLENSLGTEVTVGNYKVLVDKFNFSSVSIWDKTIDNELCMISPSQNFMLRINKTKLPTQDIQGFKQWLQTNNVTVVYQLAEEKVYECTNIDLITYANETNYIVESGAIVPRSTLKVHNNISNVVSLLQKKVSLLESNITRYTITQNRLMLTSRYNADTVGFKVDVATLRNSFEYDNDLYELILNNILVGKDNYDREYIENLIIFYWMDFVISDEMHSALFEIIEEQHNPKVIEDEEAPL